LPTSSSDPASFNWASLADALVRVERLSANDSGLLSFGAPQAGGIFVEQGRICWVAVRGLGQRLRDLLLAHCRIDAAELDRVSERCRARGKLVGQTLVEEGRLSPDELEKALRQHSAECLLELCRDPLPTHWSSHAGRGYAPRFTFRAEDLLLDAVSSLFPRQQLAAQAELARLAARGHRAAAFVFDPARECLLPIAAVGSPGVEALRSMGQWATSMPMVSRELAAEPSFSLASTEEGEATLVWWREGLLFAVSCDDRMGLAAATALHLACA
jgi:hypothetical protein